VDEPTLSRFYSFHFLAPMLVRALILPHLGYLHLSGSNNPLGLSSCCEKVPFHWYYSVKDVFGFCVLVTLLLFVVFFAPLLFLEPDNFMPANPLVTPPHIVPE